MTPSVWAKKDPKSAVVKIYTVFNSYNYREPWQMWGQQSYHGSGCIIDGGRVLTNAHVVSDQTFIQVRRAGFAKRYTARLEIVAHECDLAILTVKDKSFFSGVTPLKIGTLPEFKDKVAVYGFPEGGDKLSITEGVVSRVEHSSYTHSSAYLLACQIDAAINSGNSGGPVIKEDKIVGVAFQGMSGEGVENIGYMVPAPVINHFLEDIKDGKYDGTPDLRMSLQKLENPDMRQKLLMKESQTGVLVNKIYPDSPARGILKQGDILLAIDGENVENDGTIEFRRGERTFLGYSVQQKYIGDQTKLRILRNGIINDAIIKLNTPIDFGRLVPHEKYDVPPTYYIMGGLVFEPLTVNYLKDFGSNSEWYYFAPTNLINKYYNGEPTDERRQVIVLIKVLADEINIGYHDHTDRVITSVNGIKISTMEDLVKAFEEHDGKYHIIEDEKGFKLVLEREKVVKNRTQILKKYRIEYDRSKDLRS
jgi:S1-C subfamily serine protease